MKKKTKEEQESSFIRSRVLENAEPGQHTDSVIRSRVIHGEAAAVSETPTRKKASRSRSAPRARKRSSTADTSTET